MGNTKFPLTMTQEQREQFQAEADAAGVSLTDHLMGKLTASPEPTEEAAPAEAPVIDATTPPVIEQPAEEAAQEEAPVIDATNPPVIEQPAEAPNQDAMRSGRMRPDEKMTDAKFWRERLTNESLKDALKFYGSHEHSAIRNLAQSASKSLNALANMIDREEGGQE